MQGNTAKTPDHEGRSSAAEPVPAARVRPESIREVKIFLDTGAFLFLWAITGDARLRKPQREAFMDEANDLYLSVASVWEILIKTGLGKLPMPAPPRASSPNRWTGTVCCVSGFPPHHLVELEKLPPLHRDPFDRMILAQAKLEGMPVMTGDRVLRRYGVRLL